MKLSHWLTLVALMGLVWVGGACAHHEHPTGEEHPTGTEHSGDVEHPAGGEHPTSALPAGQDETQICIVTDRPEALQDAATNAGAQLVGPKKGFLIQGEDRIGVLHAYHLTLSNANVNVYSSSGVCDGKGRFGFILWVEPGDFDKALVAFDIGD